MEVCYVYKKKIKKIVSVLSLLMSVMNLNGNIKPFVKGINNNDLSIENNESENLYDLKNNINNNDTSKEDIPNINDKIVKQKNDIKEDLVDSNLDLNNDLDKGIDIDKKDENIKENKEDLNDLDKNIDTDKKDENIKGNKEDLVDKNLDLNNDLDKDIDIDKKDENIKGNKKDLVDKNLDLNNDLDKDIDIDKKDENIKGNKEDLVDQNLDLNNDLDKNIDIDKKDENVKGKEDDSNSDINNGSDESYTDIIYFNKNNKKKFIDSKFDNFMNECRRLFGFKFLSTVLLSFVVLTSYYLYKSYSRIPVYFIEGKDKVKIFLDSNLKNFNKSEYYFFFETNKEVLYDLEDFSYDETKKFLTSEKEHYISKKSYIKNAKFIVNNSDFLEKNNDINSDSNLTNKNFIISNSNFLSSNFTKINVTFSDSKTKSKIKFSYFHNKNDNKSILDIYNDNNLNEKTVLSVENYNKNNLICFLNKFDPNLFNLEIDDLGNLNITEVEKFSNIEHFFRIDNLEKENKIGNYVDCGGKNFKVIHLDGQYYLLHTDTFGQNFVYLYNNDSFDKDITIILEGKEYIFFMETENNKINEFCEKNLKYIRVENTESNKLNQIIVSTSVDNTKKLNLHLVNLYDNNDYLQDSINCFNNIMLGDGENFYSNFKTRPILKFDNKQKSDIDDFFDFDKKLSIKFSDTCTIVTHDVLIDNEADSTKLSYNFKIDEIYNGFKNYYKKIGYFYLLGQKYIFFFKNNFLFYKIADKGKINIVSDNEHKFINEAFYNENIFFNNLLSEYFSIRDFSISNFNKINNNDSKFTAFLEPKNMTKSKNSISYTLNNNSICQYILDEDFLNLTNDNEKIKYLVDKLRYLNFYKSKDNYKFHIKIEDSEYFLYYNNGTFYYSKISEDKITFIGNFNFNIDFYIKNIIPLKLFKNNYFSENDLKIIISDSCTIIEPKGKDSEKSQEIKLNYFNKQLTFITFDEKFLNKNREEKILYLINKIDLVYKNLMLDRNNTIYCLSDDGNDYSIFTTFGDSYDYFKSNNNSNKENIMSSKGKEIVFKEILLNFDINDSEQNEFNKTNIWGSYIMFFPYIRDLLKPKKGNIDQRKIFISKEINEQTDNIKIKVQDIKDFYLSIFAFGNKRYNEQYNVKNNSGHAKNFDERDKTKLNLSIAEDESNKDLYTISMKK